MARIDDILHDLIDDLETIGAEVKAELAAYIAALDPLRLGDPDDLVYNAQIVQDVARMLSVPMQDAHRLGQRAARLIAGSTSSPGIAPILAEHYTVVAAEIQDTMVSLGQGLDRYLTQAQRRGMSPDTVLDTIDRALRSALGDATAVPPPRDLSILVDVRALYERLPGEAVGGAARAGQYEQHAFDLGDPDDLIGSAADMPMMWVCALVNTCPDCLPRHNTVRPLSEWIARGLPQMGWSVCGAHCKCQTIAAEVATERVDPLQRVSTTHRGLTVRSPNDLLSPEPDNDYRRQRRDQRLAEAYHDDIEVRRAFREAGRQNAQGLPDGS